MALKKDLFLCVGARCSGVLTRFEDLFGFNAKADAVEDRLCRTI